MSDNDETKNNLPDDQIPSIEKPEFESPAAKNLQNDESSANTSSEPVTTFASETVIAPKKNNKKLIGIISGVAVLAACICIAVFAGPKIMDAFSSSNNDPKTRLKTVLTMQADKSAATIETNQNSVPFDPEKFSMNGSLDVSVDPSLMTSLPAEYESLTQLSGQISVTGFDKTQFVSLALQASQKQLATINVLLDRTLELGYIQIPELSPAYLSVPVSAVTGTQDDIPELKKISSEEYKKFLTDEIDLFLKDADSVEVTKDESVTASNISSTYDKLSVTLKGNQITTNAYDLVNRLSQEEYFTQFYTSIADAVNKNSNESMPSIEDLLASLKSETLNETDEVVISFYVDSNDQIHGITVRVQDGTEEYAELGYKNTGDKNYGFELYVKSNEEDYLSVSGTYTKDNDLYTGSMTCSVYDADQIYSFDIGFTDLCCTTGENAKASGTLTISSSELMGVGLTITYNVQSSQISFSVSASMGGMNLASVSFAGSYSTCDSAPVLDSSAAVYDAETQSNDYLNSADLFGFLQNLTDATGIDFISVLQNALYGSSY